MTPEGSHIQLARSLHDGVAQELVALAYKVDAILALPQVEPEIRHQLRSLREDLSHLTAQIRDEIYELRDEPANDVERFFLDLTSGLSEEIVLTIADIDIPKELINAVQVIGRELINNAAAHARASRIEITIASEAESLTLTVFDDGRGGAGVKDGHFGIRGIIEVAKAHNGTFSYSGHEGTTACLTLPLPQ